MTVNGVLVFEDPLGPDGLATFLEVRPLAIPRSRERLVLPRGQNGERWWGRPRWEPGSDFLVARRWGVTTTAGYGPRFLHSTGQLHKGGPASGLFLQVVDTPEGDLPIPGSGHGFGDLVRAQAVGDYRALVERDRAVLRVRLGGDRYLGLANLARAFEAAD
jgi:hypothetical protein